MELRGRRRKERDCTREGGGVRVTGVKGEREVWEIKQEKRTHHQKAEMRNE